MALPDLEALSKWPVKKLYRVYTHAPIRCAMPTALRELRYCEELTGRGWPVELRRVLLDAKAAVAVADAQTTGQPPWKPRNWPGCWLATTSKRGLA